MAIHSVKGAREVIAALKGIEPKLAKQILRKRLRSAAKPIAAEAKAHAPKDTGLLVSAIRVRAGRRRKGRIAIRVQIGEGDFKGKSYYGAFREYGTVRMEAAHFLRDAYEARADQAAADLRAGVLADVEAAARGR